MDRVIRVLVANRPRLLRELIVATLADEPDVEIIGEVSEDAEIPNRVAETLSDLLVISLDESERRPVLCDTILHNHADIRTIAVAYQQNRTVIYWASSGIHSNEIESSEQGLLRAVRSVAGGVRRVSYAN
jgi:DNA-binding NarL/FixJ family response regulator